MDKIYCSACDVWRKNIIAHEKTSTHKSALKRKASFQSCRNDLEDTTTFPVENEELDFGKCIISYITQELKGNTNRHLNEDRQHDDDRMSLHELETLDSGMYTIGYFHKKYWN